MERYLKPVRIKRAGLNLPLNPSIITKENGYHCQNQHLTFSLQSAVLPVSMVQWSFVMSLCKYSLCSLSSHLLNSSKAVQEQIFCFVNYTHSLVPRFFISIFSDFDGKKKKKWERFHECQICSVSVQHSRPSAAAPGTPQPRAGPDWCGRSDCGAHTATVHSSETQLAVPRRKTSLVSTWTSQASSLNNLCLDY